ncbi:MAG TPA: YjbE family putative metal transport protein [Stellaceae bacterium]|nr:YjbE family putative metal transport protein [Stellaceae bacterium]
MGASLDRGQDNAYVAQVPISLSQLSAFVSVVVIDIVLAGDNAIVVGLAASRLAVEKRRRVVLLGIAIATLLRIFFAYFTARLLAIIGLTLAGGLLLLWVAWKLYRELAAAPSAAMPPSADDGRGARRTLLRIVIADVSMSLDNVLALAGTARQHFWILSFGLVLSVALMGLASNYIARLLDRHFWISWVGLAIVTFVALRMIWDGSATIISEAAALPLPAL